MEKSGKGGIRACGLFSSCSPLRRGLPDLHDTTGMPEMGRLRCIPPSWGENGFAVAPPAGQGSPGDRILNALSRSLFT
ncbi:hypothetical protein ASZ90_015154 [hydrocarbon metagenome]|uniref:Uncharacterized protein n=1 Tax=hydrocarbon metagenome TaxID=938273 RepID=A0A0W8F388_9ZZZZ